MLKGSIVALVTPFDEDNKINYSEFDKLLEYQISNQTDGILLLGTTAESESLSREEKYDLVCHALHFLDKRIPVMVGLISNNTKEIVRMAEEYKSLDIDSFLVSAPYYVKSNTEGLDRKSVV